MLFYLAQAMNCPSPLTHSQIDIMDPHSTEGANLTDYFYYDNHHPYDLTGHRCVCTAHEGSLLSGNLCVQSDSLVLCGMLRAHWDGCKSVFGAGPPVPACYAAGQWRTCW